MKGLLLVAMFVIVLAISYSQTIESDGYVDTQSSVGIRLVFGIDNQVDDSFIVDNNYVIAEDSGTVVSISSFPAIGSRLQRNFTDNENAIDVRSAYNKKFIVAFINGTNSTVTDRINSFDDGSIPSLSFSSVLEREPLIFPIYFLLKYTNINIIERERIPAGPIRVIISNEGKDDRGLSKIQVRVL